jgi:hypothetical protein
MTLRKGARLAAAVLFACGLSAGFASAQETFRATAEAKNAKGQKKTAPVRIRIDRYSTEAERQAVMKALKEGNQPGLRKQLETMEDIGWIDAASTKTPIKYAFERSTGGGRIVTVVTAKPIVHLGSRLPDAKPREGYDLATAILVLEANHEGHGEFAPAGKITIKENDALAIEDYGGSVVWLKGVFKANK